MAVPERLGFSSRDVPRGAGHQPPPAAHGRLLLGHRLGRDGLCLQPGGPSRKALLPQVAAGEPRVSLWGAGGQQEPLKPGTAGVTGVTQEGTAQAGPQCAPFIERLPHGGPRVGVGGPGAESTCRALHCRADPIQSLKPCKCHQLIGPGPKHASGSCAPTCCHGGLRLLTCLLSTGAVLLAE